ncbi:hypothetical protein LPJ56_000859 [Coemansia sp. RSA 2599]|nr:hypothetical protein LPJ75_000466 [Coemansia sp. RSA 2598]KAJ1828809.1 hypothetical protein LPJ56_000859 [Coemansia sp. RSA 2599]
MPPLPFVQSPLLPLLAERACSQTIAPKPVALCSHPASQRLQKKQQQLWAQTRRVTSVFLPSISRLGGFQPIFRTARPTFASRSYFSSPNGRNPFGPPPGPLWWVKPAAYTAGGVALAVFAWPLLRFVVIGGLAYGAYRLARVWWALRELNSRGIGIGGYPGGFSGSAEKLARQQGPLAWILGNVFSSSSMGGQASSKSVRTMSRVAEASIRAALSDQRNHRIKEIFCESVGGSAASVDLLVDAVELGEPVESQVQSVSVDGGLKKSHVEAVFPLYVDEAATPVFVHVVASGDAAGNAAVCVDAVFLLARLASGEVRELAIDVCGQDDSKPGNGGFGGASRGSVQDAEYRDV